VGLYLLLCVLYWAWSAVQLVAELRDVLDVKHFINNKLGISDRQVGCTSGAAVTVMLTGWPCWAFPPLALNLLLIDMLPACCLSSCRVSAGS